MDLSLSGKVIIVTGGAQGIGAAICDVIAEEGGIAIIFDKNEVEGKSKEKLILSKGFKASFVSVNLNDADACSQALTMVEESFGKIDGLVNNAGKNDGISLINGSPEAFERSVKENLLHYYHMAHYATPWLQKSEGAIVNISSKTAVTGQGGTSGYTAAKGAQLSLTREWAVELLPYNIRVNAVIPAEVWTPLYQQWINSFEEPEQKLSTIKQKIPLGNRMTSPREIANMVVFLLSGKAAHITGQHIFVDGGYTHLDRSL